MDQLSDSAFGASAISTGKSAGKRKSNSNATGLPAAGMWSRQEAILFTALFLLSLASRGLSLTRSFATDDYWFTEGAALGNQAAYFSQGRILAWLLLAAIESVGVNIVDCGFLFGIAAMAVQAAFVVVAIRFVGLRTLAASILCGAIMVLHPYNVEIYTYKIALPVYILCMLFVVAAIEASRRLGFSAKGLIFVNIFATIALLCYQIAVNYLASVALCGLLAALLVRRASRPKASPQLQASLVLLVSTLLSGLIHVVLLRLLKQIGIIGTASSRSMLIEGSELPLRIHQIREALGNQVLLAEPILGTPLKILLLIAMLIALFLIGLRLIRIHGLAVALPLSATMVAVLLIASIGVIVVFKEWYPAPRVVAHGSVLFGLLLLVCFNHAIPARLDSLIRPPLAVACGLLVLGYSLIGNQIIADQIRVNQWDAMLANRILGRLESIAASQPLSSVIIYSGPKSYQRGLKTAYFDMNISAFNRPMFAKAIIAEATGAVVSIRDKLPEGSRVCQAAWPMAGSVKVEQGTATICLSRQ